MLRKLFNDFDKIKSGSLTVDELAAMVAKLGISIERKFLQGIIKELDANKSGQLEYDEFSNFIINDPYK